MATPDVASVMRSETSAGTVAAGFRPVRTASQGVAAAVSAAGAPVNKAPAKAAPVMKSVGPRKRSLLTTAPSPPSAATGATSGSCATAVHEDGDGSPCSKARRTGFRKSAVLGSGISRSNTANISGSVGASVRGQSLSSYDTRNAETAAPSFPCKVCGLVYASSRTLSSHVLAMHGTRDHRRSDLAVCPPRRPRSTGAGSPRSAPRSSSPGSDDRSNGRCHSPDSGDEDGTHATGGTQSGFLIQPGASKAQPKQTRPSGGPKRQSTGDPSPAVRTRPTNNQLLYKAYFRWHHYPYNVRGARRLATETEACASVTSAFLQVLSTLHAAESAREDSPRNILQVLSTNTRRTKVVELSSGTHRVPDDLRKHCLNDSGGHQYSTNLDRNRYGSDNQYLNTVIRYDLDFLGLCPSLVDVEIIDAKNPENTILIQANGLCNCGCDTDEAMQGEHAKCDVKSEHALEQRPSSPTGMFDMLLLAATGEAIAGDEEEDGEGEDGEEGADANSQATDLEDAPTHVDSDMADNSPVKVKSPAFQVARQCSSNALASMENLEKMRQALLASDSVVADLRKQLKASAEDASSTKARVEQSEAKVAALQAEVTRLATEKATITETLTKLQAESAAEKDKSQPANDPTLRSRVAELEAQLNAVTRDRDTHAASHSYYAVWVQQLQAEVTNLLKTAHANGGNTSMVTPQLVALTQAVNPAASMVAAAAPTPQPQATAAASARVPIPPAGSSLPSESDADSALRAQYEQQLQQLLQQHFQTMLGSSSLGFSFSQPAALTGLMPLGASTPNVGASSRSLPLSSPLLPLDIAPLKNLKLNSAINLPEGSGPFTSRSDSSDGSNMHVDLPRPASATASVSPTPQP